MATTDANGILFYETTDPVSPLQVLLNGGQQSVSDAISTRAKYTKSVAASTPASPADGDIWYQTDTKLTLTYDLAATKWKYQSGPATIQIDSPSVGTGPSANWDMTASATVSSSATKNASQVGTVSNGTVTIAETGLYTFSLLAQFASGFASGVRVQATIQTSDPLVIARGSMGPTGGEDFVSTSCTVWVTAGVAVMAYTYQASGGIVTRNMARYTVSRLQ